MISFWISLFVSFLTSDHGLSPCRACVELRPISRFSRLFQAVQTRHRALILPVSSLTPGISLETSSLSSKTNENCLNCPTPISKISSQVSLLTTDVKETKFVLDYYLQHLTQLETRSPIQNHYQFRFAQLQNQMLKCWFEYSGA